jgi:hypothetical protein
VLIYSKANQRGLSGGLADKLLIPYDKEIMNDYDLYFSKYQKLQNQHFIYILLKEMKVNIFDIYINSFWHN